MNKLIILSTIFLMSCASSNYKRRDIYQVRYTVREYYLPVASKPEVKPMNIAKKSSKPVKKKASRLDCAKVFKEINQCMKQ